MNQFASAISCCRLFKPNKSIILNSLYRSNKKIQEQNVHFHVLHTCTKFQQTIGNNKVTGVSKPIPTSISFPEEL